MAKVGRRGFLGLLGLGAAASALGVKEIEAEEPPQVSDSCSEETQQELADFLAQKLGKKKKKKKKKKKQKKVRQGTALKPDMHVQILDTSFFCDECTERGKIVEALPGTDGLWNIVRPRRCENYPVGLLLTDVVDLDLTRCHLNWHNQEAQKGGKVQIMQRGTAVVRPVNGKPVPGAPLYYEKDGVLTTKDVSRQVGRCLSTRDKDEFVKVQIDIR